MRFTTGHLFFLSVLMILSACVADPVLTYEAESPAQVLGPIASAGISDGRARFRTIFCERFDAIGAPQSGSSDCNGYLHRLSDESSGADSKEGRTDDLASIHFVLVPGFMSDAAPGEMRFLGPSSDRLVALGYDIDYVPLSGGGSAEHNAGEIARYFESQVSEQTGSIVVIAYSKGVVDVMRFLVGYPGLAQRIDAVVSYAGAVNGSPLAEVYPEFLVDLALSVGGSDPGDGAGLSSLRPSVQMPWLAKNPLPDHISYFSLAAFTGPENVSVVLFDNYDRLAQINAKNDGQLIYYDQVLPGSTLLGYMNGDHWAIALPFTEESKRLASTLVTKNVFPRDAMLEAVLVYVSEQL